MSEYNDMSASEQKKEDWMNAKWRPMMGWMYMLVCTMDFVAFPVLWSLLQAMMHVTSMSQWQPLTLQGAGLFHMAMGAIIGVAAFGRTQEKLAGANNGGINVPPSGPAAFSAPPAATPMPMPTPVAAPAYAAPKPAAPVLSSSGKPMPAAAPEPEL